MSDQNNPTNGLNHASNDGLNDADIKHLFDQQRDEPPQALNELILAAAKSSDKVIPAEVNPSQFSQKYTAVFGLAAVVVLSVVIVPLMIKQPESTLDANNTSNDQAVASLFEQEMKPIISEVDQAAFSADINTEALEVAEELDASGGGDAGSTMADASALTSARSSSQTMQANGAQTTAKAHAESATAPLTSEPVTRKRLQSDTESLNNENSEITQEERATPLKWIEAIKRLFEQKNLVEAKAELARFRQQHPDSEHEALLPATLLEQTSAD